MRKEESQTANVELIPRLQCSGVWGGIRNLDTEITAGKVIGSIYSAACCGGGKGGDIYYFGVCKGDMITRLAIADVVGHGEAVTEVSKYVYSSINAHI